MATVTLTRDVFHRVAALAAFTATKDEQVMTPTLGGVQLSIAGGELRARATDRYTAARVVHEHVEIEELAAVSIPAAALTEVFKGSKSAELIGITHDEETSEVVIDWATGSVRTQAIPGNYPPLDRLFPENPIALAAGTKFSPKLLARLAKLTIPARAVKDREVMFEFYGTEDERPNLYAKGDAYEVLICPRRS